MMKLVLATLLPNQIKALAYWLFKVSNEKCTRTGKMFEVTVFTQLFCVKSILHANPLSTKSGMPIIRDWLSSRTSTQFKVSGLLIFSVAEKFASLQWNRRFANTVNQT